jgi:hypothetical protein
MSAFLALAAALVCACANSSRRADTLASSQGFKKQIEIGDGFRHVVYRNTAPTQGAMLHVYIEGDGTPYWRPDIVAVDPTPHDPLMLRLMALDSAHSVYLGRPCYFALYRDDRCSPLLWTLRRFSPEVLDSMEAVLRGELARAGATQAELFGHSGGGTLAVLLAQRVKAVTRVVTLGANLDLPAWCALHHFAPLLGSVNPVGQPTSRTDLKTLHLVGENDTNTPPFLVQAAARARGGELVRVVMHFDHQCCWESMWRAILREEP